ncbi:MAG: T9SS type A sorting domain-containing protein [Draconibacterium sp.]|nr:T9SS type A sorting domain-containing protein [Draconibacterium sp.]
MGKEAPYWVRLTRQGNKFSGYIAPDGETWKYVGAITIPMNTTILAGLCVSSTLRCTPTTVVFDSIRVDSNKPNAADDIFLSDSDFEVFPNPFSKGSLTIKLPTDATLLAIFDVTGKLVYKEKVMKNEYLVDESVFPIGWFYLINVVTNKQSMNKNVIVNK